MARKYLSRLKAEVLEGQIRLECFIGTREFNKQKQDSLNIRVYRMVMEDFEFGPDYEEYFDGLDYHEAELIFEGSCTCIEQRRLQFSDNDVRIGITYAYWVLSDMDNLPIGPVYAKVRDPKVWWSKAYMDSYMENIAQKYAKTVTMKEYGLTTGKRKIKGLIAGNPNNMIALIGTIHAGESGPEIIIPVFERFLELNPDLLENVGIAILPSVNIDQREKLVKGNPYYIRKNINEVDINRNFKADWDLVNNLYGMDSSEPNSSTYRGPGPESEDETKAVIKFIHEVNPQAVFSFHWLASVCADHFLFTKAAESDQGYLDKCKEIASAYSLGFRGNLSQDVKMSCYYSSGSLATWVYEDYGAPCFDVEGDRSEDCLMAKNDKTTPEIIERFREKHYNAIVKVLTTINNSDEQ